VSRSAHKDWGALAADGWALTMDAAAVVPLRLMRLALGGERACAEARLMVTEKVEAHSALVRAVASGEHGWTPRSLTGGVLSHYRPYVRANRRRLAREMLGRRRARKQ